MNNKELPYDSLISLGLLWWFAKASDEIVERFIDSDGLPDAFNIVRFHVPGGDKLSREDYRRIGVWLLQKTPWKIEIPDRIIKLGKRPFGKEKVLMERGSRYIYNYSMPKIEMTWKHRFPLLWTEDYYGTEVEYKGYPLLRNRFRPMLPSEVLNLTGWRWYDGTMLLPVKFARRPTYP